MVRYRTMSEAVQSLKRRGFTSEFELLKGMLYDIHTGLTYKPEHLTIVEHHRFEEAGDSDDLSTLYAVEAADGTRGTITDAYGPYANPDFGMFLRHVRTRAKLFP